jgi:hypothetical protein
MRLMEPTLPAKSGLWTSSPTTVSAKASAVASSCPATLGSTGTTVAAWEGATVATGAGGTSTSSVPGATLLVAMLVIHASAHNLLNPSIGAAGTGQCRLDDS